MLGKAINRNITKHAVSSSASLEHVQLFLTVEQWTVAVIRALFV